MANSGGPSGVRRLLICRVGAKLCGVPLAHVVEVMRPLPTEPLAQMASFVLGIAVIRSRATPVVDARKLLSSPSGSEPARYVTLELGGSGHSRVAALAVDGVVGVRDVSDAALGSLPPLLREQAAEVVTALGTLDAELLLVLEQGRLLSEAAWQTLERERESA
jgi:purine-binding chemotaxis protein CheW